MVPKKQFLGLSVTSYCMYFSSAEREATGAWTTRSCKVAFCAMDEAILKTIQTNTPSQTDILPSHDPL